MPSRAGWRRAPSAADIYRAIEEHLANLVQRNVVLFGARRRRRTASPDNAAVPERVRAAVADMQHGSHARRPRSTTAPATSG